MGRKTNARAGTEDRGTVTSRHSFIPLNPKNEESSSQGSRRKKTSPL